MAIRTYEKKNTDTKENLVRGIWQNKGGKEGSNAPSFLFNFPLGKFSSWKKTTNHKVNLCLFFYWRVRVGNPTLIRFDKDHNSHILFRLKENSDILIYNPPQIFVFFDDAQNPPPFFTIIFITKLSNWRFIFRLHILNPYPHKNPGFRFKNIYDIYFISIYRPKFRILSSFFLHIPFSERKIRSFKTKRSGVPLIFY